jgi:competence protein ComEA
VLVAATVAAAAFFYYGQPATNAVPPTPPAVTADAGRITVHVSGAVAAPGLVEVAHSARVADVIAAAGGTTSDAVPGLVNLAAPVRDGEQIVVPSATAAGETPIAADGRVRLNTAAPTELEQIPGVGPVLAGRIIEARDAVGGFTSVEDLLDVAGIGEAKLAALRDFVVVP